MTLLNGDILKLRVRSAYPTGDEFLNIFYLLVDIIGTATDSDVLNAIRDRLRDLYDAFDSSWNQQVSVPQVVVQKFDVPTQTFVPVGSRLIGSSGNQGTGALPGVATGSATARTNVSRVRGRKSFSGFDENSANKGLLGTIALTDLSVATAFWLAQITAVGTGMLLLPGVQRTVSKAFVEFNGTGLVKNIQGTMTTRKALRGQ